MAKGGKSFSHGSAYGAKPVTKAKSSGAPKTSPKGKQMAKTPPKKG